MDYEVTSSVYHNNNNINGIQSFEKKIMHPKEEKNTTTSQDYVLSSNIHEGADGQDVEEIRNQTRKVLEAFFSSERAAKAREKIVKIESRRTPSTTIRQHSRATKTNVEIRPHISIPSNGPDLHDGIVRQLISSKEGKNVLRHKPTRSIESSESTDSVQEGKHMTRTKSFSKAQRNSIVTDLERKSEKQRRSSVDVTYSTEKRPGDICVTENKASPVHHGRASSDSLIQNIGVDPSQHSSIKHGSDVHKSKEEKKKQTKQFWKIGIFKSKKKEASKSKEESREYSHPHEVHSGRSKSLKKISGSLTVSSSERHPVSRENSSNAHMQYDLAPLESPKPKRTPKLLRKISMKFGKTEASAIQTVQRKSSIRSQSLDIDNVDGNFFDPSLSGDLKSNSLPPDATNKIVEPDCLSQSQREFSSNLTSSTAHTTGKNSATVTGNHQKASALARSQSHHQDSNATELVRPTTLKLHKKKNMLKKVKRFFRQESSSSSSSDDEMDLRASDPAPKLHPPVEMRRESKETKNDSIQYSKSDNKSENDRIRRKYQHRASKSMSDVDSHERNYAEIAEKLRKIADFYGPIVARFVTVNYFPPLTAVRNNEGQSYNVLKTACKHLVYVGPSGRTETPDSYNLSHQHGRPRDKERSGSQSAPVTRETSLKSSYGFGNADEISSHSMKAYMNMSRGSARNWSENRITRDQISHRPTGSFDSPHAEASKTSWTERTEREWPGRRLKKSSSHAGDAIPKPPPIPIRHPSSVLIRYPPRTGNESATHPSRSASPRPPPSSRTFRVLPSPRRSTSPQLTRSAHHGAHESSLLYEVLDHDHIESHGKPIHVEKHVTETTITTSPGMRRKAVKNEDITEDVTDAIPFGSGTGRLQANEDFASAFSDGPATVRVSKIETTEETETVEYRTSTHPSEIPNSAAPPSRPHRQRSQTTPNIPCSLPFVDDEEGAVGGEESLPEDKLVEKLVQALCKRGDEYNDLDLATPVIDVALGSTLSQMSAEKVKDLLGRVSSRISEISLIYPGHHEILQIAWYCKMTDMLKVLMQSSSSLGSVLTNWTQSLVSIVQSVGGWSTVEDKLEETLANTTPEHDEGPGPSGLGHHNDVDSIEKRRNGSDTDDELD